MMPLLGMHMVILQDSNVVTLPSPIITWDIKSTGSGSFVVRLYSSVGVDMLK
jgi:hypothetical protein